MKRVLLVAALALLLVACNKQSSTDQSVANATVPVNQVANGIAANGGASTAAADTSDLKSLSNRQLTDLENKCILSDSQTCEKPIDDEWHRRGWCAYDATGKRKPHCTAAEIEEDEKSETSLDNMTTNAKPVAAPPLNSDG